MDQFQWNFKGLLDQAGLTYRWVVPLPSPHLQGVDRDPDHFPEIYLIWSQ